MAQRSPSVRTLRSNKRLRSSYPVHAPYVESIPVGELRPNPRNARTHPKRQLKLIKRSISKFGQIKPVIVDDDNVILAGHGFVEAAKLAELDEVLVLRFDHLTETQKRAYLLADNKIAEEAGWDRQMLAIEFGELIELMPKEGLDISITGFDDAEVDLLLVDMADQPQAPEAALPPIPQNPVTQRLDLWRLGKHRLLCDDAQNWDAYSRLLNGVYATAVFCDPPYNLRVSTIGGRGRTRHAEFAFASGEMSSPEFRKFLTKTIGHAVRVSRKGAVHYVCIDWRHVDDLIAVGRQLFGAMLNLVVWKKTNAGQGSFYRSQHELIGVFRVGEEQHLNNIQLGKFGRGRSNVWTYPGVNTFGRGRMEALTSHPTVKQTPLVADALLDCTARGDAVLDQFAGSGTILLAAEKVGRTAYAMEIDPGYVDVAIKRWQAVTKLEATLEGDGRTFEEIAQLRTQPQDRASSTLPPETTSRLRPQQVLSREMSADMGEGVSGVIIRRRR